MVEKWGSQLEKTLTSFVQTTYMKAMVAPRTPQEWVLAMQAP